MSTIRLWIRISNCSRAFLWTNVERFTVHFFFSVGSGTAPTTTLEKAINLAWGVGRERNYFVKRLVGVLMFLAVGGLLGISTCIYAIRDLDVSLFGIQPTDWPWVWSVMGYVLPPAVTIGTFTMIYKILPNTHVKLRVALIGGVFAGVLWEAAKAGFTYYVSNLANYSKVYGSLGGIILLVVWINYSAVVTILGAEVASVTEKGYREHREQGTPIALAGGITIPARTESHRKSE